MKHSYPTRMLTAASLLCLGVSAFAADPAALTTPGTCIANILYPARFESRSEQVLVTPATTREEAVPATYKTVTEKVLVQPEMRRQVPVPAQMRTVTEDVVVRPAGKRLAPVPPVMRERQQVVQTRPAASRYCVRPPVYEKATERVLARPEHIVHRVIPAQYREVDETVEIRPASTRTVTNPGAWQPVAQRIMVRPETLQYVPVKLPTKQVAEKRLRAPATVRVREMAPVFDTVTTPVEVRPATVRHAAVEPAWEITTEQVKVSEPYYEWRRGRAWVGQAIEVLPLRGFVPDASGQYKGHRVADMAGHNNAIVDTGVMPADNARLDDDVMCLVEVPAQYRTVTRRNLRSPGTVTDVIEPAIYRHTSQKVLLREAGVRLENVPAQYHSVYHQEVDFERARAMGYKFSESGELIATPDGHRLLRAADVARGPGVQIDAAIAPDAWVREVRIPAAYRDVTHYVPTSAPGVQVLETPAVTRTIRRRELVQPERLQPVVKPAEYKTVQVHKLTQPEVVCEEEMPAEYATLTHYEVEKPAGLGEVPVPEVRQRIAHEEVAAPAGVREEIVPAVYREETRRVIDQPATTRTVDVPAVYKTVTRQVQISEAREEQREVLCAANTPPERIRQVQQALRAAGFAHGGADGVLDPATLSAVADYQLAHDLPTHGYLDEETVKSLGLAMH